MKNEKNKIKNMTTMTLEKGCDHPEEKL